MAVSIATWVPDQGVSNPTLGQFQKTVTIILQSFHSACLFTCYPGDLPTPDAKRENVLCSNRGVVSAVKLEIKHLFNNCIPQPNLPFLKGHPALPCGRIGLVNCEGTNPFCSGRFLR